MADSLLVSGQIELIGADTGVASVLPQCPGAVFIIAPDYDLGAPQPVTQTTGDLVLDGEILTGSRASNRTISLPVQILAPGALAAAGARQVLAAAREVLLQLVDQPTWTLTWTRDGGQPMILDCFRASPSKPVYSITDEKQYFSAITLTFEALPYGRAATPTQLSFASPASGTVAPPSPVSVDSYTSVSGTDWTQSSKAIVGSHSARWAPPGGKFDSTTFAFYEASVGPVDITGRTALSVWAGFGSDEFGLYSGSQQVTFSWTLTDAHGASVSFGTTTGVTVAASGDTPAWNLVTTSVPQSPGFDFTLVAAYSVSIYNFSGGGNLALEALVVYLDALTAQAPTFGSSPGTRGAVYTFFAPAGTSHAALNLRLELPPVTMPTVVTLTGSGDWTALAAEADVEGEGAGGAGAGLTAAGHGGGAGSGAFSREPSMAFTIGDSYPYSVGAGGTQGSSPVNGGTTTLAGDDTTLTAQGGKSALQNSSAGALGGAASGNTISYAGGSGANGSTAGGGAGAPATPAGPGASATSSAGAGSGGEKGGNGATGSASGSAGTGAGAGGGGANSTGSARSGANGQPGSLTVTYNSTALDTFSAVLAHRPGINAPQSLNPLLSVGNGADTPNGATEYLVQSLVAGLNARFGSTYSIMLVASSFASPGTEREVTVQFNQHEYSGGPVASQSVSKTFTPATDAPNGMIVIDEITLPLKDLAPDNTEAYFGVTVTSENTSDRFLDMIALDALGQLVWVNTAEANYSTYWIDAPITDRDQGRVLGSPSDRTAATSVLGDTFVSGGPLVIDAAEDAGIILVYSPFGPPAVTASYSAAVFLDTA